MKRIMAFQAACQARLKQSHDHDLLFENLSLLTRATTQQYAQRWQVKNPHTDLKTQAFNLEGTGLTQAERMPTLLTCVFMAFI